MDRQIVYPGELPRSTDILLLQRNAMVAIGSLIAAALGTQTVVDGLLCFPTSPASMGVVISPGTITQLASVDPVAFGGLGTDTSDTTMKMGISNASQILPMSAPTGSGQSINYLVQAAMSEQDTTQQVLPYYNAANPQVPFSGPSNAGTSQPTQRRQTVALQVKAGAAAAAGTQNTPAVDTGYVGLWIVTVSTGQTSIPAGAIVQHPASPIIAAKLPTIRQGFSAEAVWSSDGTYQWTCPRNITVVRARVWGAGGSGGSSNGTGSAGSSGGGGGYVEGYVSVTPGQAYTVTVGAGAPGTTGTSNGVMGGTSNFQGLTAGGGAPGSAGLSNIATGTTPPGGSATGGSLTVPGQHGGFGYDLTADGSGTYMANAPGGGSYGFNGPQVGVAKTSASGGNGITACGGSGGILGGGGGAGGDGLVVLEW